MPSVVDFSYSPCALVLEAEPTEQVRFQSFPVEEGIVEGYNADYVKTPGRASEPFGRMWTGGDWAPINLSLEFRAGMSYLELGTPGRTIGKMISKVDWLKAAAFPRTLVRSPRNLKADIGPIESSSSLFGPTPYGGQTQDPPIVLFVWGFFMVLRGRITAWTVTWKGPFQPISGKPHGANVQLTFQPESGMYPDWYTIKDGTIPSNVGGLQTVAGEFF